MNKNDYNVAINRNDDTIVVTYKRGLVAKSKNGWLRWFVICMGAGIIELVLMVAAWSDNIWLAVLFALSATLFFLIGYVFIRQFVVFRRWLRELERSTSEERGE